MFTIPPIPPVTPFPASWEGKWLDEAGKCLEIKSSGKLVSVTFRLGLTGEPFPFWDEEGRVAEDLEAHFDFREGFACTLAVDLPMAAMLKLDFWWKEEGEMRRGDIRDAASSLLARPSILSSWMEEESTSLSWAYPLLAYRKAAEKELG